MRSPRCHALKGVYRPRNIDRRVGTRGNIIRIDVLEDDVLRSDRVQVRHLDLRVVVAAEVALLEAITYADYLCHDIATSQC